jgi:hypothetical protein
MDCEKFEASLVDELYEELDELTSAAAKRHVAGCVRCASRLGGLRAARRVAVLPRVEPSLDLEDRILSAARDAQMVVPVGRRLSRAVSLAGSWAMRPQTAMAAVFILMVGSSVLFVRRSKVADSGSVTVTAQGRPASESQTSAPSADIPTPPLDFRAAAAAHGAQNTYPPTPAASAAPAGEGGLSSKERSALPKGASDSISEDFSLPAAIRVAPAKSDSKGPFDFAQKSSLAAAGGGASASNGTLAASQSGPYAADSRTTDFSATLLAADALRGPSDCGAATESYDQVAQQAWGTQAGYEATFKAGLCYQAVAENDLALQRFQRLITVPKYAPRAQELINKLSGSPQSQSQLAGARTGIKRAPKASPAASAAPQAPAQPAPSGQLQPRAY